MLDGVRDMNGYLRTYGRALADGIKDQAEPLFSPGDTWDERLYRLRKKPYQAQGDAIMGLSRLLDEEDSALVVGEMGCGKTLVGLSVPYVHGNGDSPARTLVMCPGHLVKKWQREALETIPDADAKIIRGISDLMYLDRDGEPERPEYAIVSKDSAKLGYAWRPAALRRDDGFHCPDCYGLVVDHDDVPVSVEYLERSKRYCQHCEGALWQADETRIRRFPPAEYVKRYLPGYYDFLVADEVHELKGGSTVQGNAFGALSSASGKTIALTGTLLGGYADDVFYVLYRLAPEQMRDEGLDYSQVTRWMARYGVLERVTRSYPSDNEPILDPATEEVIAVPAELPKGRTYPKEEKLLELVRDSLSDGRRVFTYCTYTGRKDVTERLQGLLLDEGIDAEVLKQNVKPEKREEWIRDHVEAGTDVVIANPKLVQTGLDLYDFPTLAFYQTGYSIFTLRQASRRSWRIGQDRDVRVHYLYYRPTMQERAMQLMGSKLEASLAIEGKFSEEGLLAMTQGEDMNTALAKALVDGLEGEGVEDIWSKLNRGDEYESRSEPRTDAWLYGLDRGTVEKELRAHRARKRRRKSEDPDQLLLFGDA